MLFNKKLHVYSCLLISVFALVAPVQAAPFARLISRTTGALVFEVGDTQGLAAIDVASLELRIQNVDMTDTFFSSIGSSLISLASSSNSVTVTINTDLTPFSFFVSICQQSSAGGECASNVKYIGRTPGGPSATCDLSVPCHSGTAPYPLGGYSYPGFTAYQLTAFRYTVNRPTFIHEVKGFGGTSLFSGQPVFSGYSPKINIFSSAAAFAADPRNGDLGAYDLDIASASQNYPSQSYLYTLELDAVEPIYIAPGSYLISVEFESSVSPFQWLNSLIDLGSDYEAISSQPGISTPYSSQGISPGTATVDLFGVQ